MQAYLDIVKKVLNQGKRKQNRTGISTLAYPGMIFEHDMSKGFPLLTTKKVPFRLVSSELEFFIKGKTDKDWLKQRNNHIWDEWCTPKKIPYAHDEETKKKMEQEPDLGPVYGFQWRHFGANYEDHTSAYEGKGVDQLKNLIELLSKDPQSRRMMVSAWNPVAQPDMALPPCHYCFQITVIDDELHLLWNQRSVDVMLGLPFNIASYGLLLHLLAKQSGYKEGKLTGFLGDVHIYENHIKGAQEQLSRDPTKHKLPTIETKKFTSLFDWEHEDSKIIDYQSYPTIKFDIAV